MEAIDFKKLLREERRRAKQKPKAAKKPLDKRNEKEDSVDLSDKNGRQAEKDLRYNWGYPSGFLAFRELALRRICENPRSISYSALALKKGTLGVPNANGDECLPDGSNISEPNSPSRITNDNEAISPEVALQNWLQNIPSSDSGLGQWKVMNYGKRRVCMFGEDTGGSLPPPLAEIAQELVKRKVFPPSLGPNHVLLNEYQPGQGILPHTDGPRYEHRTATLSLGSDVVIEFTKRLAASEIGSTKRATINNKSAGVKHGTKKDDTDNIPRSDTGGDESSSLSPIQILLESGSLLVFDGDAYLNYCHGIEMDVWRDVTTINCLNTTPGKIVPRGLRYSLTFRHKKKSETKRNK